MCTHTLAALAQALMAITVFEGCMIISGAVAGNVVLDEVAGRAHLHIDMHAIRRMCMHMYMCMHM